VKDAKRDPAEATDVEAVAAMVEAEAGEDMGETEVEEVAMVAGEDLVAVEATEDSNEIVAQFRLRKVKKSKLLSNPSDGEGTE
jgi:hypothetical protein